LSASLFVLADWRRKMNLNQTTTPKLDNPVNAYHNKDGVSETANKRTQSRRKQLMTIARLSDSNTAQPVKIKISFLVVFAGAGSP